MNDSQMIGWMRGTIAYIDTVRVSFCYMATFTDEHSAAIVFKIGPVVKYPGRLSLGPD